MKKKDILWLYLFLFATLIDMAFLIEQKNNLRFYSKPLIVLGLLIYFYQITKPIASTLLRRTILAGLIFSLIGDVLLLWEYLFIYGIGAFFLVQACYIIGFKVAQKSPGAIGNINFVRTFLINMPVYFFGAFTFYLINPNLGILKIPVLIYIIALISMVTTARERYGKCNPASFWQVFIGAFLFLISDAIVALDKFYTPVQDAGILIAGTYAVAQLMILMGIRSFLIQPK